jgi:hypothetical protein
MTLACACSPAKTVSFVNICIDAGSLHYVRSHDIRITSSSVLGPDLDLTPDPDAQALQRTLARRVWHRREV